MKMHRMITGKLLFDWEEMNLDSEKLKSIEEDFSDGGN